MSGIKSLLPARVVEFEDRLESTAYRFYVLATSMSFRYKIAAALLAVLCLAITSLGIVSFTQQKDVLEHEMQKRAEVLVRQVANAGKTGLLTKDELTVYSVMHELESDSGVDYAQVLDNRGHVFAYSSQAKKSEAFSSAANDRAIKAEALSFQRAFVNGHPVLEASMPITSKLGTRIVRVGTARVGISQEDLLQAIRRQKIIYGSITAVFMLFGLFISFALGNLLSRQIVILATAMKVVAQGNLNTMAEVRSRDDIGRLTQTFNDMILKLREKLHMEKYLSQSTLQLIRRFRDEESLKLGGDRRHMAALFSDIRGFTSMSETMSPEETVALINVYLNLQAEVIYQHQGTVDKFVGDEVMAIFTGIDCELNAARAAVEIQRFVASLNHARAEAGLRRVEVGVGLNSGEVIMGNMGSERQMNYTVIGDAVNVAARLCSSAKAGQILMSAAFRHKVGDRCSCEEIPSLTVKGKKEPLEVFSLSGANRALRTKMRRTSRLPASYVLQGLDNERRDGQILDLSEGGCLMEAAQPVGVGGRLTISSALSGDGRIDSVPALVRYLRKSESGYVMGLVFENLGAKERGAIAKYVYAVSGPS